MAKKKSTGTGKSKNKRNRNFFTGRLGNVAPPEENPKRAPRGRPFPKGKKPPKDGIPRIPGRGAISRVGTKLEKILRQMTPLEVEEAVKEIMVSLWAESARHIDGKPWSYAGREYATGAEDCDSHRVKVKKWGRQTGKTQGGMNEILHYLKYKRESVLFVFPTMDEVKDFSAGRFQYAYDTSPELQDLFAQVDNVYHKKTRAGAELYLRGSRSRTKLQSIPVSFLYVDEIDTCDPNNLPSARECLSGRKKEDTRELYTSTPTIPDYGIEELWERSDKRVYILQGDCCKRRGELLFPDSLEWKEKQPSTARYRCRFCKKPWGFQELRAMVAKAALSDDLGWIPQVKNGESAGFWLPQLYSPTIYPGDIVAAWELAQGNPVLLAEFFRYKMACGFAAEGARLPLEFVDTLRQPGLYMAAESETPTVAGCDVGGRHHLVVGKMRNGLEGLVEPVFIGALHSFDEIKEKMVQFKIDTLVIDEGPEREKVMDLSFAFPGRVYACHYPDSKTMTDVDDWDHERGRVKLHRTYWIDKVMNKFRRRDVPLPADAPEDLGKQFHAPVRVEELDKFGKPMAKYISTTAAGDHYVHAFVYLFAAGALSGGGAADYEIEGDPSFETCGYLEEAEIYDTIY